MINLIKLKKINDRKRKLLEKSFLFLSVFFLVFICGKAVLSQTVTTFTDVTGIALVNNSARGMGAAWGDYNNDGLIDLYVSNYKDKNILYKNNGNDTFADVTDPANVGNFGASTDIAWGDYNNDGFPDLFLVNGLGPGYGDKKILYKNNGDGTFEDIAEKAGIENLAFGMCVSLADYDNDGLLDVYFTNNAHVMICSGQSNKLYRNNGDDTFSDVTEEAGVGDFGNGMGVAWCDYDNDGDQDLYMLNFVNSNIDPPENNLSALYNNNGDGTFTLSVNAVNSIGGHGVAWGDYNNDGNMDVYIANVKDILPSGKNVLYKNNGDGTFTDVTDSAGVGDENDSTEVTWVDYDNDGDLDLHVVNGGIAAPSKSRLYQNNGDSTFTDLAEDAGIQYRGFGEGASWGDYDNDGDMDVYMVNYNEPNILYRNNGNTNHWIEIQTKGTVSNASGIGTRVKVVSGELNQIREVSGGDGFCSQDSLLVHFGLGINATIDTLEVRWPSGKVQIFENIEADQILTVTEE